ncbi:putative reverse transcriptase domain-containing protein [Tanacetum coccineum]
MVQTRQPNNPPDVTEIIAQQLQNIIPNIMTQVTNNLNNGNGNGNGRGNNGCTYKGLVACGPRDFDKTGGAVALTRWIEKMESVIDNSGCLFFPSNEIEKLECEFYNHSMVGADHAGYTDRFHELEKLVSHLGKILRRKRGSQAAVPPRRENGNFPKCARCKGFHVEKGPCIVCYNCQRPGHMTRDYRTPVRHAEPIRAVRPRDGQRSCYECGSLDHLCPNYLKWNRGRNQSGNQLALEGNRNTRGNKNRARGRDFNVNAVDAL